MDSRTTTRLTAIRRRLQRSQDIGQAPKDHLSATAELMANAAADIAFLLTLVDDVAGQRGATASGQRVRGATGQREATTTHGWAAFFSAWWQSYGERQVTVSDLLALAKVGNPPVDLWGAKNQASQKIRLGRALQQRTGHTIAGFQITLSRDRHTEVNRYALARTRFPGADASGATLPLLDGFPGGPGGSR